MNPEKILARHRRKLGLSKVAHAGKLGVSASYYRRMETTEKPIPQGACAVMGYERETKITYRRKREGAE